MACWIILTLSRSHLKVKVAGQISRPMKKLCFDENVGDGNFITRMSFYQAY